MLVIPIVEMFRKARIRGIARSIVPRRNAPNVCAPAVPVSMNVVVPVSGPTTSGGTRTCCAADTRAGGMGAAAQVLPREPVRVHVDQSRHHELAVSKFDHALFILGRWTSMAP